MRHWMIMRMPWFRDRLRCPACSKVGTWKPHGGARDRRMGDRGAKRWLCKWCGHYVGPEGVKRCGVGSEPYWQLLDDIEGEYTTPQHIMGDVGIDPWRG